MSSAVIWSDDVYDVSDAWKHRDVKRWRLLRIEIPEFPFIKISLKKEGSYSRKPASDV